MEFIIGDINIENKFTMLIICCIYLYILLNLYR